MVAMNLKTGFLLVYFGEQQWAIHFDPAGLQQGYSAAVHTFPPDLELSRRCHRGNMCT
jgi:hypothetical protein